VTTFLIQLHQRLGFALLIVLLAGAVAAVVAVRSAGMLPTLRTYLWLAFAAISLQAVLGIVLLTLGERPTDGLHLLYGPLTFLALPVTALLSRGAPRRSEAWTLAAGFVVALLLAFRALSTG
jgi:heme A synthase